MIRIGFDPMLEVEQHHQELLKEAQLYRLAKQGLEGIEAGERGGFKFLALIGKEMVTLGASLEERFGGKAQSEVRLNQPITSEGCD
jgi:hypothetical protein